MGVCIWGWANEGIPCFIFVDLYILRGRRGNLCDCVGYVNYCIYFFIVSTFFVVPMLLFDDVCRDSYSKWFYTWLGEF